MTYFDITLHIYLEILTCGYRLSPLSYPLPPATPISPPTGTSDPDKSWSTDNFCDDEPPLPKTKHDKINKLKNKPLSTNNNVSAQKIKMNSQFQKKYQSVENRCDASAQKIETRQTYIFTYSIFTYSNKKNYTSLHIKP